MAAALPYCDLFLPAHSLAGLHQLLLALAVPASRVRPSPQLGVALCYKL